MTETRDAAAGLGDAGGDAPVRVGGFGEEEELFIWEGMEYEDEYDDTYDGVAAAGSLERTLEEEASLGTTGRGVTGKPMPGTGWIIKAGAWA